MSSIFFIRQEIIEISKEQLDRLKQAALQSPLRRARLCLHLNHRDKVQEMVIAFCRDSYVRPHRHLDKSESFHIIEGELEIVFFDNKGGITRKIRMGTFGSNRNFLYRLSSSLWHTVVPLSDFVIVHETTTGPFVKSEKDYAVWSPDYDDKDKIKKFLEQITNS